MKDIFGATDRRPSYCRVLAPVLCISILVVAVARPPSSPAAAQTPLSLARTRVLIDRSDRAQLHTLQAAGGKLLADYGAFQLWQQSASVGTAADTQNPNNGQPLISPLDRIGLRGGQYIDTRTFVGAIRNANAGEMVLPGQLQTARTVEPQLALLQFIGPVKDAWLKEIQLVGVQWVTYLPNNAYLIWADGATLGKLDDLAHQDSVVAWVGSYEPAYRLAPGLQSAALAETNATSVLTVTVQLYDTPDAAGTLAQLQASAVRVVHGPWPVLNFINLTVQVTAGQLAEIAHLPTVVNIEPQRQPHKTDERQGQIMAGNLTGHAPSGPGYLAWLQSKGVPTNPEAYPIVAVVDDGVDNGSNTPIHPDFYQQGSLANPSRLVFNQNCTADLAADGGAGHGNLNAGIVAGYSSGSQTYQFDAAGYLNGMGIVPYGRVANAKIFANLSGFDISNCDNSFSGLVRRLYANGARISSNSWGTDDESAYGVDAQNYDALTRDADPTTPTQEQMLHVFSAGNAGGTQGRPYSVGSPGVGKNVLTVAAAENVRDGNVIDGCGLSMADSADDVAAFSSRGPANDGRAKPDIIAPGTHIMGPASQSANYDGSGICGGPNGSPDRRYYPNGQTWYTWSSGTSHSAPAVAGAAALAYELYGRTIQPGQVPSPAMLRALLLNGTRYMTGVGANDTLPGAGQGWGAVNLSALYTDTVRKTLDQQVIFGESGQTYTATGTLVDSTRPFRVTLAWTDAPGSPVGNAYVNDLDLNVEINGVVYRGNVFSGALSVAGGVADGRNNVEHVFLPPGVSGSYLLTVTARNIAGNGVPMDLGAANGDADLTDQDFALVLFNGDTLPAGNGAITPRQLEVAGVTFAEDSPANGNGAIDPGERIRLNVNVDNRGVAAHDIVGKLSVLSGNATWVTDTAPYAALAAQASGANLTPFVLDLSQGQPCEPVQLAFNASYIRGVQNEAAQVSTTFFLPMGLQILGATQSFTRTHAPPLVIPDNNEVGVQSTLLMPASTRLIDDIDVRIDTLNHTWTRDLVIRLIAPSGKSAQLFYRRGRNATTLGLRDFVFDQQSNRALSTLTGAGPYSGAYQPEQTLDVFANEPISGMWTLSVQDVDPLSSGALVSWGLNIRSKTAQCALVLPTVTPTPSSTPSPSPTPTVTRTPSPSTTPTVTNTPAPSPTPTVTRTPVPSLTPSVTRTPLPTAISTSTKTPVVATATPTKVGTSTPAPTSTSTPPDVCAPVLIRPNAVIPDKNSIGLCYDIPVTQSGTIYGVAVRVSLAHTWVSDLRMQLRSPYSTTVTLMNRPGFPANAIGDSSDLAVSAPITFSSAVGGADPELMGNTLGKIGIICKDDRRCVYTANPDGDTTSAPAGMTAFNGQASAGNWRFCVSDHYQYDIGTLNEVGLDLACLPNGTATPAPTSTPAPTQGPNLCAPVSIAPNESIPDNRVGPTCFTLPVTQTGRVNALALRLDISHTYISDLKIQLRSPNSTTLTLLNRPGIPATRFGDSSDLRAEHGIIFSDAATVDAERMGNTLGGTAVICRDDGRCSYVPNPDGDAFSTIYSLAGFAGEMSAGDWQVCISDVYPKDIGMLTSARLDLVCSAAPVLAALPPELPTTTPTALPTLTLDELTITPTPSESAMTVTATLTGTAEEKIEMTATPTIAPDIDLNLLDKPEEPDTLPAVYLPLLIVLQ